MDRRLKRGYESLLHSVLLADLLEEEGIADESNSSELELDRLRTTQREMRTEFQPMLAVPGSPARTA